MAGANAGGDDIRLVRSTKNRYKVTKYQTLYDKHESLSGATFIVVSFCHGDMLTPSSQLQYWNSPSLLYGSCPSYGTGSSNLKKLSALVSSDPS